MQARPSTTRAQSSSSRPLPIRSPPTRVRHLLHILLLNLTFDLAVPVVEFIGESYPAVMTAVFWPLLPFSRGHVHIASSNPFADPIITPRLYSDEFDVKFGVKVARKSRELFSSAPFQAVVADPYADPATVGANATDADYKAFLLQTSFAASHWVRCRVLINDHLLIDLYSCVTDGCNVYAASGTWWRSQP